MVYTIDSALRDNNVQGDPGSGEYKPQKGPLRTVLKRIEGSAGIGAVTVATKAELDAITDKADNAPGFVVGDSTASNNGQYFWDDGGSAWVKIRDLPDTLTVLENIGGTANAITADTATGVDPAAVQAIVLTVPPGTNTSGGVTIRLNGGGIEDVKAASGTDPAPGDIVEDVATIFFKVGAEWRQIFSSNPNATFDHQGIYENSTTYTLDQVVTGSDGKWYQLKVASATGDDPVSGGSGNWLEILDNLVTDDSIGNGKLTPAFSQQIQYTVADKAALKALDIARYSRVYVEVDDVNRTYVWRTGDYTGLEDSVEYISSNSIPISNGAWVAEKLTLKISTHGEASIPRLSGQLAQNVETFVTDGDTIFVLCKGSYSLNDSSFVAVFQNYRDGVAYLSAIVDIGVGADCRAMTAANGFLYIFSGQNIFVYKTEQYGTPVKVASVVRPSSGFVQTCSFLNGLLVAPVWGSAAIETYTINSSGIPVLYENFVVSAGSENSSIVDAGDGSFLLIRHVSETNALGRFHFSADNKITNMTYYSVSGMLQCRYGVVRNSSLYTGSFSTGDLLEIDLLPSSITSAARTFSNMSSFVLYDRYLIGALTSTGDNVALNIDTGLSHIIDAGEDWLYPRLYGDTIITFINGDETKPVGATANDSPMGQKIAIYNLSDDVDLSFPKIPGVNSTSSVFTPYNAESSFAINSLVTGYNAMGTVVQDDAFSYGWAELKVSGFLVDNQASGGSLYKLFEGRALLLYSGGAWVVKEAYADDVSKGASSVVFSLSVGSGLSFGLTAASDLPNAVARIKVEIRNQMDKNLSI